VVPPSARATGEHSSGSSKKKKKKREEARSGNGDARIDPIPASNPAGLYPPFSLSLCSRNH
jgi:hypothetical protein